MSIDQLKLSGGLVKYRLPNATVLEAEGYHFIDYLDDERPDTSTLDEKTSEYINNVLHYNNRRVNKLIDLVRAHVHPTDGARCLDVGCGGGLFMAGLAKLGIDVVGIEPNAAWAEYARKTYGLSVETRPIEHERWDSEQFDLITLWDVIEHVNWPARTIQACARKLKPGGFLMIDTPCRDGFYYRFGETTYRLSRGRFPTLLSSMYSADPYCHKQIFTIEQLRSLIENAGLSVNKIDQFHEHSSPEERYLFNLTGSQTLSRMLGPIARTVLAMMRIKNKAAVVASSAPTSSQQ